MSMTGGGGGGGINLPPLVQQIQVRTSIGGQASAQFNGLTQAVNRASSAAGGMTSSWGGMYGAVNRTIPTWRATGDALRMTGSLLTYQVAMPLIKVGTAATKAATEFETSMKKIQGLVGITGDNIAIMSSKVLDMAGSVGKAPQELADALYYITSAGIKDTNMALDTLNVSARAAAAGLGTTKDVADLSTSIMNAYAPGLYNAQVATDALVAAVREGKADAEDFAPAMGKVIPVAAAFGVKFQDVAAAVAALTRQGAPAGTAAIQLRQVLGTLLNPTQKATEELSKYGMSARKLRETIQQEGLLAGLSQLKGAFGDNAAALTQVFGNIRPLQAVMALIGPSAASNAKIFEVLNNSSGDTAAAFDVMSESVGFKLGQATAEGKVALIKIGDALAPLIKGLATVAKVAAQALGFLASIPGGTKFVAVLGAMSIGMIALVKTFASFIRMRAYTTIALQGITNGLRDQTTGMVTNIQTGVTYSTGMGIATTSTARLGAAATGAAGALLPLAGTTGELSAFIAELMAVMTENGIVTAENTLMMRNLTIAQGGTVGSTTAVTEAVLAGDTAFKQYINSTMTASGSVSALTGAEVAGTAAVGAEAAATAVAAETKIYMAQSTMQNVRAAMIQNVTNAKLIASTSMYGLTLQVVGIQVKKLAVSVVASGKAMLGSLGPMIGLLVAAYAAFKLFKWAMASGNKEVNNSYKAIQGLTDTLSNFRVAPIIVGIDVQYNVEGGGNSGFVGKDGLTDSFRKFLFSEDANGDPSKSGQKIKDEIDGFADDVTTGAMSATKKMQAAVSLVGQFAGDVKTRGAATAYFAQRLGINPDELATQVSEQSEDAKAVFESNFIRFQKEIAEARFKGGAYGGKEGVSGANNIGDYFKAQFEGFSMAPDWEKGLGVDVLNRVGRDIKNTADGFVGPLKDALSPAGGSAEQFVGGLESIYDAAYAASKSTKFAEMATLKFAKAAFKAAGISDKGATVQELLTNNSGELNSAMNTLSDGVKKVNGATDAANISNKSLIDTFNNKFKKSLGDVKHDVQGVSDVIASLNDAFDGGLNEFVRDAASIMDAYTEALKSAKKGQDALFGSQLSLIDSQANYGAAISTALTDISEANGNISGGSAESLKAQQSLGGVFKASMEVANSIYANTTGTAEQKQAAATAAAKEYIDAANKALTAKGGLSKKALDTFWNGRLGKKLTTGDENIETNAKFLAMTFGQDEVQTGSDTIGGVVQGMNDSKQEVYDTSVGLANAALDGWQHTLGIKSPSTVMRDQVGKQIVEGVILGLRTNQVRLTAEANFGARRLAGTFTSAFGAVLAAQTFALTGGVPVAPTGPSADDIATEAAAKDAKEQERKEALAKAVKLQGSKTSKGIYDTVATNLSGQGPKEIYKKGGRTALENFAEGVLEAKSKVKTNVTKLIKEIISEVSEKLSIFSAVINAQLNLSGAKNDLKKFMVDNTPAMLAASVAAATRAVNQSQMKYGAGEGTEVTKYERSKISTAKAASDQAQRDYRLGKISYADMIDAQTEYATVQATASEASKENADATNTLSDATYLQQNSTTLLAAEQMKVVTAQNDLATAYVNAKIGGSDLKDTLDAVARQAGITSVDLLKVFDALVGKTPASVGVGPTVETLIPVGKSEADDGSITDTRSHFEKMQALHKLPTVKPAKPKKGAWYRGPKGLAHKFDGKAWKAVPGYAKGGNIMPGQVSMVGENGPELVRSASAMNVTPFSVLEQYSRTLAHAGSKNGYDSEGSNINIVVNNPVPERASDSIARRMQNMSAMGLFG